MTYNVFGGTLNLAQSIMAVVQSYIFTCFVDFSKAFDEVNYCNSLCLTNQVTNKLGYKS